MSSRVTVVIATRNRRARLSRTLRGLSALPNPPPVVVVDNGSLDGSSAAVRDEFGGAVLLPLDDDYGVAARNLGVLASRTPYVAFSDDDSWWAPGALERAAQVLDAHPRVGLVAARTLVEPGERIDPLDAELAASVVPEPPGDAGPAVLGFLVCGAVLRRTAFLAVGGFSGLLVLLGAERLLAYDLAASGWQLVYREDVVVHHHDQPARLDPRSRSVERRNAVLTAVMRRPPRVAAAAASALARESLHDPAARAALTGALVRLPAALRHRVPLPPAVENRVQAAERHAAEHGG